jgi:hypothetical protein
MTQPSIFLTGDQGQSTDQPAAPQLPAIPAYDGTPEGLASTMSALVETTRRLAGQIPFPNNENQGGGRNSFQSPKQQFSNKPNPQDKKPQQKGQTGRFTEQSRTKSTVTVKDSNSGATLTYQQITGLVMKDNVTGETWEWKL